MFNNFRRISPKELKKVNAVLEERFGNRNRIESGSYCENEYGKNYHIKLVDSNPYKAQALLREIGRVIKNVLGADKIYCLGKHIA